jgi:uncharacterized membrane protein YqhA
MHKDKFLNFVLFMMGSILIMFLLGVYALRCPRLRINSMQWEMERKIEVMKNIQDYEMEDDTDDVEED